MVPVYLPISHLTHAQFPTLHWEYFPTSQLAHDDCPVLLLYVPGAQSIHDEYPCKFVCAVENVPIGQSTQEMAFKEDEYLPAAQTVHTVAPLLGA
jgi:hypothetical protein